MVLQLGIVLNTSLCASFNFLSSRFSPEIVQVGSDPHGEQWEQDILQDRWPSHFHLSNSFKFKALVINNKTNNCSATFQI